MNPYLNPFIGIPFFKDYLIDPGRIIKQSPSQIEKYRNKIFRKIIRYAYTVPLYHEKYKRAGIYPNDIKGLKDLKKLPFITRKDLIDNFPDRIIPLDYNKSRSYIASTGGSSGKPVSIYTDFYTLTKGVLLSQRQALLNKYNLRKVKIVNIGTHMKRRIDYVFDKAIIKEISIFRKSDSYITLNAYDPIMDIVKKLDEFKPDIIYTYPVTLLNISYFKRKGYGKNINPILLESSGYTLDEYNRNYVEDVFGCRILNLYQTVEAESDIAFECSARKWHINYDFFHVETINEQGDIVEPGKRGHVVLTRLFGRGTPIIRYTGMDDWVTLTEKDECKCGLCTPGFKNGVEGRISAQIFLPNGRVYPAASFAIISLVLNELKTYKVAQFQIIQNKFDEIVIKLVIDEELRNVGPPVDLIFKKIKEVYQEKCGPEVNIIIEEVKEIKSPPGKPLPLVISKIKPEEGYKLIESLKS
jgi:phenylacetate-CoA ligase